MLYCKKCGLAFFDKPHLEWHKTDNEIYLDGKNACDYNREKYDGDINRDSKKLAQKLNRKFRS